MAEDMHVGEVEKRWGGVWGVGILKHYRQEQHQRHYIIHRFQQRRDYFFFLLLSLTVLLFFMLVHMHKLVNANVCMAIRGNEDVLKNALIISVACERTRRCSCFRSNIGDLP